MSNKNENLIKMITNGQFQKIIANQTFFDFYEKLVQQFEVNNIPQNILHCVKDQARLYAIDDNLRMSENVITPFNPDLFNIKFLPHREGVELYRFEIFDDHEETGAELMNFFLAASEQLNIKIYLNPSHPGAGEPSYADEKRMKRFFRSFGFKPIPGLLFWRN